MPKSTRCKVCSKNSVVNGFCQYHHKAYENLLAGYTYWKKAYGGLSWKDYIDKIKENEFTGIWVKEVIRALRVRDDKKES